jgi:molybdate transport system permease protein
MDSTDLAAVWLTLKLATVVTLLLLVVGTPIAWWLARTRSAFKGMVGAIVALPLVLPPTVLGFYLLVTMGPNGPIGQLTQALGLGLLPFTFPGLVIASIIYSLPFVVQPIQNAFEAIGDGRWKWPTCAPARGTASGRWRCRWPGPASCPAPSSALPIQWANSASC